jgi:hypothetical protein
MYRKNDSALSCFYLFLLWFFFLKIEIDQTTRNPVATGD